MDDRPNLQSARRSRPGRKKRLNAALDEVAESGRTEDPTLSEYILAQHINLAGGGPIIAPWQVGSLPERYIQTALGMNTLTARRRKLEQDRAYLAQVFTNWRKAHPAYRS